MVEQTLEIETREEAEFLRLTLRGTFPSDWNEAMGAYARIFARASGSGYTRFLSDVRGIHSRPSLPDVFVHTSLAYPDEAGGTRTATLDLPENMTRAKFFETLMHNKGRVYRVFFDEALAIAWLLSEDS